MTNGSGWEHRACVNQALGIVAEQTGGTMAEALALLHERAFANGQTLAQLAVEVIEGRIRFDPPTTT